MRPTEGSGASGAVTAGSRSARWPCCTRGPNPRLSQAAGAVGSLLTLPGAHLAAGAALTRRAHEACHPQSGSEHSRTRAPEPRAKAPMECGPHALGHAARTY